MSIYHMPNILLMPYHIQSMLEVVPLILIIQTRKLKLCEFVPYTSAGYTVCLMNHKFILPSSRAPGIFLKGITFF